MCCKEERRVALCIGRKRIGAIAQKQFDNVDRAVERCQVQRCDFEFRGDTFDQQYSLRGVRRSRDQRAHGLEIVALARNHEAGERVLILETRAGIDRVVQRLPNDAGKPKYKSDE